MVHPVPQIVRQLMKLAKEEGPEVRLSLIAYVTGSYRIADVQEHPIITEFFSDGEVSDLLWAIRSVVSYCELFQNEADFFDFVSKIGGLDLPNEKHIAYSTVSPIRARAASATIPLFCAANSIETCTIDPYGLALTQNKFHVVTLLRQFGLPVPDSWLFSSSSGWINDLKPSVGQKVIAKPVYESASIGIDEQSVFCWNENEEVFLKKRSYELRQPLMVQAFVPGQEVEVPVIGAKDAVSLPPCSVVLDGKTNLADQYLTFETVFNDAYEYKDFNQLEPKLAQKISVAASTAHILLTLDGISRVDFRISDTGRYYITDLNAVPHLTRHGAVAHSFQFMGLPYEAMIACLVGVGLRRRNNLHKRPDFDWCE